jgi:hypothetical protein
VRTVPAEMTAAWYSGEFIGSKRPIARVTIQRPRMQVYRTAENLFTSIVFADTSMTGLPHPVEMPNIKSVNWNRSIETDAAECTLEFWNTRPLAIGEQPTPGELDRMGFYTFATTGSAAGNDPVTGTGGHGHSDMAKERWGKVPTHWSRLFIPDALVRTYEGYGCDPTKAPEDDPNLVQTGVWMIDEVEYHANGLITVNCRDLGRLLMDHMAFPPVVPFQAGWKSAFYPKGAYAYPIHFTSKGDGQIGDLPLRMESLPLRYHSDSGSESGHPGQGAFDGDLETYWLSEGLERSDQDTSFVWVQGTMAKQRLRQVKLRPWMLGPQVYVSVFSKGEWRGREKIPAAAGSGMDIPFVRTTTLGAAGEIVFNMPGDGIVDAEMVRLTMGNLSSFVTRNVLLDPLGDGLHRGGVRSLTAAGGPLPDAQGQREQNYDDYTDIVKLFCAWAGFYWPEHAVEHLSKAVPPGTLPPADPGGGFDPTRVKSWRFLSDDEAQTIRYGRVWGDWQNTGTYGVASLGPQIWDKKSLMDGINYIRDIVGFIFQIDELGGAVWRAPNIYNLGNIMRTASNRSGARTKRMVTIDERQTLIDLRAKLSSRNVRERIFVSDTTGRHGGMAKGWTALALGMRRVGGWTDQNFETSEECQVMADMIALRQMMTYRTDTITIPGYPAIQVDDQVRIFERTTADTFVHYVKSIGSSLDMLDGSWTYDLETQWLGERPFDRWAFNPEDLSEETQYYLSRLFSLQPQYGEVPG